MSEGFIVYFLKRPSFSMKHINMADRVILIAILMIINELKRWSVLEDPTVTWQASFSISKEPNNITHQ